MICIASAPFNPALRRSHAARPTFEQPAVPPSMLQPLVQTITLREHAASGGDGRGAQPFDGNARRCAAAPSAR